MERSLDVQARLLGLGLTSDRLQLIGSFIVAYGLFETTLERALWNLHEVDVKGARPFTEKLTSEQQFKSLSEGNPKLSVRCNAVLRCGAAAAEDLNEYRNSLVHGHLLAYGPESAPSFMKNPAWHGERRNKPVGDAYIHEPLQDLVLSAAWTLFKLVARIEKVFSEPNSQAAIEALEEDVRRARSHASEARHLRSLMNHEKH
jgi:hypothetical protein